MRSRIVRSTVILAIAALWVPVPARAACSTAIQRDARIPSPSSEVPGFPYRRALTQELNRYVGLVDGQSPRVQSGTFATSWNGTQLPYALVSSEDNLVRIDEIVADQKALRDPRRTDAREAARIARSNPAIVWYTGNVHGGEFSGADAAIQILYELASRSDCEVKDLLSDLVIGIIPTQNPDGRDVAERTNAYGFDMNRDWFAWTQPETDGKIALLADYPPLLFIDAHEQGSSDFFFPPNADPVYHEISGASIHWINDLYGPAMAEAFDARRAQDPANWDFFNYDIYDLFYMGYGDTVPTTAFTAAGMTFEKGTADPDHQRMEEQFVAGWTSLKVAAKHRRAILDDYYRAHVSAVREGARGVLEANRVYAPGNKVSLKVPGMRVRHYFIDPERAFGDAARVIERLLRLDVEVYRLNEDLRVHALRRYGSAPDPGVVPRGSFWIPMDQPQKRWIQAMLGEDTYVPFPYFYDVTAWSNPLLSNLRAWFTGADVKPRANRLRASPMGRIIGDASDARSFWFAGDTGRAVAGALALDRDGVIVRRLPAARGEIPRGAFVVEGGAGVTGSVRAVAGAFRIRVHAERAKAPDGLPIHQPKIALYAPLGSVSLVAESLGHLRYVLDRVWRMPYTPLTGQEIAAGALTIDEYDVLVVPGVGTAELTLAREQIRLWLEAGGTYVGTARPGGSGGTGFAIASGYTTSTASDPASLQIPGTMFRVALDRRSPVTLGAPDRAYWFHLGEQVMTPTMTGTTAARFPKPVTGAAARHAPNFWYSGYSKGQAVLEGTGALVEEKLGDGRVILFSGEPNYRAFTDGTAFLLANAIALPDGARVPGTDVGTADVRAAMASIGPTYGPGRPIRIEVPVAQAHAAMRAMRAFTPEVRRTDVRASAFFMIPNPAGLAPDEHPFLRMILPALRRAGVRVLSAIL